MQFLQRKWQLRLLFGLIALISGFGLIIQAQAAKTAPQPPTSSPSSVLGLNLSGGFTQQPIDSNQVAGSTVTLSAKGTRSALEAATNLLGSRKYVWWESTDNGQTYQTVGKNSSTYSFTAPEVTSPTPLLFQVQYDFTGIGLFSDDWSRIATVTVTPSRIPATDIQVSADKTSLNNGETTMVHASLSPATATDPVTWKSSDSNLATVDSYGDVTATNASSDTSGTADDHGTVTITGTANGHSDSVKITVGSLQNVTVQEGTAATFTLADIPSGMTVSNWYRVKDGKSTALNSTASSYTIKSPTNATDDGTSYYAALNYTVNGTVKTVTTNAALLTVTKGGDLTLKSVPNLDFGTVNLETLSKGTTLATTDTAIDGGPAYDGNNEGNLDVTDNRSVGGDWTLSASLAPFGSAGANSGRLGSTQLELNDNSERLTKTIPANNTSTPIFTQSGYKSQSFTVTDSKLIIAASPLASAATYHSTITWTLAVAPTN